MKIIYSPEHAKHDPKTYFKGGAFHEPQEVAVCAHIVEAVGFPAGSYGSYAG